MRLTLLVVATGMFCWNFQSSARADEHAHPPHKATATSWKAVYAELAIDKQKQLLLERLQPFLNPAHYLALDPPQRKEFLRYAENRLDSDTPVTRCWSPNTARPILFAYHAVEEAAQAEKSHLKANQFFQRWNRTALNGPGQNVQGRAVTLTWSIVPDGTAIPKDPVINDSDDPSSLRARLGEIYGGNVGPPENQPWFPLFSDLFDEIGAQCGITYVYEANDDGARLGSVSPGRRNVRGDIRLSGHDIDGDGDTLAYNYFPDNGDMVIDTNDSWFEDISNNSIRLVNTVAHEHGHGLGLQHVCPIDHTKLLEPSINTNFRGIQFDEIYTLQRWYGDPCEDHEPPFRDNDAIWRAKALTVSAENPFDFQWLSIDDNSDTDYYSFTVPPEASLRVRVSPSDQVYLEGGESGANCSNGSSFDSSSIHDLSLELLDRFGKVLAAAQDNPAGQAEELAGIPTGPGGQLFIRIEGGAANQAQLYRLEIELDPPAVSLEVSETRIITESHAPANGRIEPGETIEFEIYLRNNGSVTAENVSATLSAPPGTPGFTSFTPGQDYGSIAGPAPVSRPFVFALDGDCGTSFPLELTLTADGGFSQTYPVRLNLGIVAEQLSERFTSPDGQELPDGWASDESQSGSGWKISGDRTSSPPFAVFAANEPSRGTSTLTTPAISLGFKAGTLRFRHYVNTEASNLSPTVGFDGGVLELSSNGGEWQDILATGATFTQGPYNRTLSFAYQNPLPERRAWSGDLGWITTAVILPANLANQSVRFRWRLGHDTSEAEEGWYLDDVRISTSSCAQTAAVVRLDLRNGSIAEGQPIGMASLEFSTLLPLQSDLPLGLLTGGTATPGLDTIDFDNLVLPAGQTSVLLEFNAHSDEEVEGLETLELSLDPAGLVPSGLPTALITIADSLYGEWAATQLGLGTANGPLDDFDLDGIGNYEEYAWQTDPGSAKSRPDPRIRREGEFLYINFPLANLPRFTSVRAEMSTDLENWTSQGVETLADGFRVRINSPQGYIRLRFDELPAP